MVEGPNPAALRAAVAERAEAAEEAEAADRPPSGEPLKTAEPADLPAWVNKQIRLNQVLVVSMTGLLALAVFYTLYFAAAIFIPIALALLLNLLLSPIIRRLAKLGLPESISAALLLLVVIGGVVFAVARLSEPAAGWVDNVQQSFWRVEWKLRPLNETVTELREAAKKVEEMGGGESQTDPAVVVKGPSLTETVLSGTRQFAVAAMITIILLYFMLASGDLFLRKLVKVLPRLRDKKRAVEIARQAERDISAYLLTITLINCGLGTLTWLVMYALGLPNPELWGVMAALLNFIPYLGPAATLATLAVVGLLTFPGWVQALLPAAVFLGLSTLEGQLITPILLGRRLTLNPVVIFIALLLWGWIWGVPGILLAVPMLAATKILCDNIEPLHPIGEFLGRREHPVAE